MGLGLGSGSVAREGLTVFTRKSIEFMLDGFHLRSDWHVPGSYGLSTGLRGAHVRYG